MYHVHTFVFGILNETQNISKKMFGFRKNIVISMFALIKVTSWLARAFARLDLLRCVWKYFLSQLYACGLTLNQYVILLIRKL